MIRSNGGWFTGKHYSWTKTSNFQPHIVSGQLFTATSHVTWPVCSSPSRAEPNRAEPIRAEPILPEKTADAWVTSRAANHSSPKSTRRPIGSLEEVKGFHGWSQLAAKGLELKEGHWAKSGGVLMCFKLCWSRECFTFNTCTVLLRRDTVILLGKSPKMVSWRHFPKFQSKFCKPPQHVCFAHC